MRRYYKKHGLSLCLFAAANILAAVSSVFLSYLMGTFVDVAMEGRYRQVVALAVGTLAYIAGNTVLDFWMQQSRDTVVHRIGRELRADVVYKIEALPWETRRTTDDGQYISMVNNDVGTVEREYLDSIGMIFFQICCFTLAVASSVAIQPVMTLIMLAISALPVIFPKLTEKTLQQGKEEEQRAKARFLTVLGQVLGGFSQLKLFHRFGGINRSFDRANEELCGKSVRFSKLRNMLYSGAYGCGNLVYLGAWVIGLFFVFLGQLTLPLLVTFTQLMTFVAGPVQIISERYSALTAARAVCKRVLGFLDAPIDDIRLGSAAAGGDPGGCPARGELYRGGPGPAAGCRLESSEGGPGGAAGGERVGEIHAAEAPGCPVHRRSRQLYHKCSGISGLQDGGLSGKGGATGAENLCV